MKLSSALVCALFVAASASAWAAKQPAISGKYLEVRSCDVYTGPCFANGEMGLAGKEGILVWSVQSGAWKGTALDGLKVIAVVRTDCTLGNQQYEPRCGKAVLIVDAKATLAQRRALSEMACALSGGLIEELVEVKTAPIEASLGTCAKAGCATVKAGNLVEVSTRCLGGNDHFCGNEEVYYPPLTKIQDAYPAFTELAAYRGSGLDCTWEARGQRSAFLGSFSR